MLRRKEAEPNRSPLQPVESRRGKPTVGPKESLQPRSPVLIHRIWIYKHL
jgi:hypothetical protein